MKHYIPEHWREVVRQHVLSTRGVDHDHLSAYDFNSASLIRIKWPDGSYALFRFAFCLRHPQLKEVAVFTEHCGYYFLLGEGDGLEISEEDWPHD